MKFQLHMLRNIHLLLNDSSPEQRLQMLRKAGKADLLTTQPYGI